MDKPVNRVRAEMLKCKGLPKVFLVSVFAINVIKSVFLSVHVAP